MKTSTSFSFIGPTVAALLLLVATTLPLAAQRSARPRSGPSTSSGPSSAGSSSSRHAVPRSSSSGSSSTGQRAAPHRPTGNVSRGGPRGGTSYRAPRYYGGYGFGFGYGYPYHFGHYGAYYSPWGYPYSAVVVTDVQRSGYGGYGGYEYRAYGAIDINVKPKRAEVYIDGRLVGTADSYDGYPRYLWLEAGPHELTLVLDGYENFVRQIEVIPDQVIPLRSKMSPGAAVRPELMLESARPPAVQDEPASLSLRVDPADASVYLDGRFIGTGAELAGSPRPLLLDGGKHMLQVVHPEYRTERRDLDLAPGREIAVDIELGRPSN